MPESLKAKSAKGFAWNFGGSLLQQGVTFIITIFLARLLTPADFGLVGMSMVFITVCQVFIDVGFTSALIQRQDNTNLTYSSIFYLNLFLGLLLTLIFYFSAPLVGAFYEKPEITKLVKWLSLLFILNSFDLVQIAILKKQLNFKIITVRTFVSVLVGGVAGVIAAFFGLGVYSLVIQRLISSVLSSVMLWSTSEWKPDFNFSMKEVKKLTGYSTYVFLDRTFTNFFQQLDVLTVGKVFNATILGFYTRATTLISLVTSYSSSSISSVFFPVLSSVQKNQKEYNNIYFKVISVIAFTSYGITGVMCILGRDIILLLFGEKWMPTVSIFQILILMACNTPINSMMANAYYSMGRTKQNFYLGLLRKALRIIPLVIMIYFGMFAFTVAFVIFDYSATVLNIFFLQKNTGLPYKKHFEKIFDGILPMGLILIAFFYFDPQTTISRIAWAIGFVIFYIGFSKVRGSEGFEFLVRNLGHARKKVMQKRSFAIPNKNKEVLQK
jgi:O-antigen/teichoic acid export membrane protein